MPVTPNASAICFKPELQLFFNSSHHISLFNAEYKYHIVRTSLEDSQDFSVLFDPLGLCRQVMNQALSRPEMMKLNVAITNQHD